MKTKIIKVDDIDEAAKCIADGGTVVFPTETVFGLGADAFNVDAINKIYTAKGRPSDNPLIVHISDISALDDLTDKVSEDSRKLAEKFWPGPLTIIFPKSDKVPLKVTAGLSTVAIRFPSNVVAQDLITKSKVYIAAPSANISGSPSPTTVRHVIDDLFGRVDYIIEDDGCEIGLESTVIDMTGDIPTILRPGAVTLEMIRSVLPNAELDIHLDENIKKPKCPGMKYKHYAPKAKVEVVFGNPENVKNYIQSRLYNEQKSGVMTYFNNDYTNAFCILSAGSNMKEYAARLFCNLRTFDEKGVDKIYAEFSNEDGIGIAVKNRLFKSAAHCVIEV